MSRHTSAAVGARICVCRPSSPTQRRSRGDQRPKGRIVNTTARTNGTFLIEQPAGRGIYGGSVQTRKIPNGAGIVFRPVGGRYVTFQMAGVSVARRMFTENLSLQRPAVSQTSTRMKTVRVLDATMTAALRLDEADEAVVTPAPSTCISRPFVRSRCAIYCCRRHPKQVILAS
jgi:hypothetical protein